MGAHFCCKCAFALCVFVLATTFFVEDALAKTVKKPYDPEPILLDIEIEFQNGILVLTNDSCVDDIPFADPEDRTRFYQCYFISDPDDPATQYWYIFYDQCPAGGVFDPISFACLEDLSTTEPPTTTTDLTTVEPTTTPPPTTEITTTESLTTPEISTTPDSTTTPEISTTPDSTTTPEISTTPDSTTTPEISTTPDSTTTPESTTAPESTTLESSTTTQLLSTTDLTMTDLPSTTTEVITVEPTTTPVPITTPPPPRCTADGTFPDPQNPNKYYRCITIFGQFYFYIFTCPATTCFNPGTKLCTYNSCPAVTTTVAPTTPTSVTCTTAGTFPDPDGDCYKYYRCILIDTTWYKYTWECPTGSYFNKDTLKCELGTCPSGTTVATSTAGVTTLPPPTMTTALVPTTITVPPTFQCTVDGLFPNIDCVKYYRCLTIDGVMNTYIMTCPSGSYFDTTARLCLTGTCSSTTTSAPITTQLATAVTTTTQAPTTTIPGPPLPTCTTAGVFPYPSDCTMYFRCVNISGSWSVYIFTCPSGSYFNPTAPGCLIGNCPLTPSPPPLTSLSTDFTTAIVTTEFASTEATTEFETSTTGISSPTTDMSTTPDSTSTDSTGSTITESTTDSTTGSEMTSEIATTPVVSSTEITTIPTTDEPSTVISTSDSTTDVSTTDPAVLNEDEPTTISQPVFTCTTAGSFPDPTNCTNYYGCVLIGQTIYTYARSCPQTTQPTYFDPIKKLCVLGTC